MKYCTKCGHQLVDEAVICTSCGCMCNGNNNVNNYFVPQPNSSFPELVNTLSGRLVINGVIWICIASLQILAGISAFWIESVFGFFGFTGLILVVGILNLISGIADISYSNKIKTNPVGIVKKYEPLTSPIIALIYNVIFGGIIGVAGVVYYFLAIRSYVMENRAAFEEGERNLFC